MSLRISSNMKMLCLRDREVIRTFTFLWKRAKWSALIATTLVFPVCLPMQATMRLCLSLRMSSWYGKGETPKKLRAK